MFTNDTIGAKQPEALDIDALLKDFKRDPIATNVSASQYGAIVGINQDQPEAEDTEDQSEQATDSDDLNVSKPASDDGVSENESEEETIEPSAFAAQFESTFGIKPDEAVDLVNSLQAFRDEQTLMRQWQVSPTEYDERMSQVREFYNTLPENGREKFNTVEGANAIWTHLQNIGQAKVPTQSSKSSASIPRSRSRQAKPAKPAYDFTAEEITKMPKDEYQRKLPLITKAFQTGRVKY